MQKHCLVEYELNCTVFSGGVEPRRAAPVAFFIGIEATGGLLDCQDSIVKQ